ncbi:Hypothetical protein PHPALM_8725 [Phytophthora palmivora]|uniref:Transposase n=1 Tax=Phytophthora palmivora TaxID=4796 RepID=A0A2P4Y949_9STRA|nr:Hypothetical protein PHPALM_8725 [Phytophthora palmivora]
MPRRQHQHDLSPHVKVAVALYLSQRSVGGHLPRGSIASAAAGFGLHRHTISKVWQHRHNSAALMGSRQQRPPPPRRLTDDEVVERVRDVPLCQRQSLRLLAAATCIPKTTLLRYLKRNVMRRNLPRPADAYGFARDAAFVMGAGTRRASPRGKDGSCPSHFNLYKANAKYYLAKDEDLPYRSCPNKRYIGKVMCLAAVARPRYDFDKKRYFDGKIGIWPIVEQAVAQRASKNRAKGAHITKNVSMTRAIYTKMLREKVFPAIREKWPGGWDIQIVSQPPRSPDMNVLDLGFFHSLQSLQYKTPTFDTDGLIAAVEGSIARKVLGTVIACKGGNNYSLPRVRKFHMRHGISPIALPVADSVVAEGYRHLRQSECVVI